MQKCQLDRKKFIHLVKIFQKFTFLKKLIIVPITLASNKTDFEKTRILILHWSHARTASQTSQIPDRDPWIL